MFERMPAMNFYAVHIAAMSLRFAGVKPRVRAAARGKSRVGGPMICPVCQLELVVDRQAGNGEVVLTYTIKDWGERCRGQRGDPVLCTNLMPTIFALLPQHEPRRRSADTPRL
jgi:hypothetical protein